MLIRPTETHDLPTATGPMRVHVVRPQRETPVPAVILYSEIYQVTAPIARLAALIAGHGYLVVVPEVYHEYEAPGTVLAYDKPGTDRGNHLKYTKPVAAYDTDLAAMIGWLHDHPGCTGRIGAFGVCLGGHLAFRAALHPDISGTACFYATDLHGATLGMTPGAVTGAVTGAAPGTERHDDTLARAAEIRGEIMMTWGRSDPHVPYEGRRLIRDALEAASVSVEWHEVDGQHAFLRDGAPRFDAALFLQAMANTNALFARTLW